MGTWNLLVPGTKFGAFGVLGAEFPGGSGKLSAQGPKWPFLGIWSILGGQKWAKFGHFAGPWGQILVSNFWVIFGQKVAQGLGFLVRMIKIDHFRPLAKIGQFWLKRPLLNQFWGQKCLQNLEVILGQIWLKLGDFEPGSGLNRRPALVARPRGRARCSGWWSSVGIRRPRPAACLFVLGLKASDKCVIPLYSAA